MSNALSFSQDDLKSIIQLMSHAGSLACHAIPEIQRLGGFMPSIVSVKKHPKEASSLHAVAHKNVHEAKSQMLKKHSELSDEHIGSVSAHISSASAPESAHQSRELLIRATLIGHSTPFVEMIIAFDKDKQRKGFKLSGPAQFKENKLPDDWKDTATMSFVIGLQEAQEKAEEIELSTQQNNKWGWGKRFFNRNRNKKTANEQATHLMA